MCDCQTRTPSALTHARQLSAPRHLMLCLLFRRLKPRCCEWRSNHKGQLGLLALLVICAVPAWAGLEALEWIWVSSVGG